MKIVIEGDYYEDSSELERMFHASDLCAVLSTLLYDREWDGKVDREKLVAEMDERGIDLDRIYA